MNDENRYALIDGLFSPAEAEKVLISVLNSKINYHNLDDFSSKIRFGEDAVNSQKRVSELLETIEEIKKIVKESKQNDLQLKIKSSIHIEFVPKH